ncbi:uncharacterized protein BDV17DRAFT_275760 [Aspergillus undulatus]|uniref:uncharacterized protein n=1 Tax=Aspergillus undulatus TaxID=1810928 RepID=UPI003CCCE04D
MPLNYLCSFGASIEVNVAWRLLKHNFTISTSQSLFFSLRLRNTTKPTRWARSSSPAAISSTRPIPTRLPHGLLQLPNSAASPLRRWGNLPPPVFLFHKYPNGSKEKRESRLEGSQTNSTRLRSPSFKNIFLLSKTLSPSPTSSVHQPIPQSLSLLSSSRISTEPFQCDDATEIGWRRILL